jgi:hypothetical protein
MLPWKKETAHRHPAVYGLGVIYHLGVFLGFLLLIALFFRVGLPPVVSRVSAGALGLAALCGLTLLVRRIASPPLRYLSSPDDYFSNALVTAFQMLLAASLIYRSLTPGLFIYAGVLFLYIPVGKLRHAVYFTMARVHLGRFYGTRGVWSGRKRKQWQV